jgi:GNAT superfamily N-acetyltransferase
LAERNPPVLPLPLWLKQMYCLAVGVGQPEGWVTNLLIAQKYRGQGFSKVLMAAVDGVGRSWNCTSIHLHADANSVSGRVPQRLYESLGYEKLADDRLDFSWMGPEALSSSVFLIEGVPLLYLRKLL